MRESSCRVQAGAGFGAIINALGLGALLSLGVVQTAATQEIVWPSSPPDGTKGWCTPSKPVSNPGESCYSSPADACARQFQDYAWEGKTYIGYFPTDNWHTYVCAWGPWGGPAPSNVHFECEFGYSRVAPGVCIPQNSVFQSRSGRSGGPGCL